MQARRASAQLRASQLASARNHSGQRSCRPPTHSLFQGYGVYKFANKYGTNVDGYRC